MRFQATGRVAAGAEAGAAPGSRPRRPPRTIFLDAVHKRSRCRGLPPAGRAGGAAPCRTSRGRASPSRWRRAPELPRPTMARRLEDLRGRGGHRYTIVEPVAHDQVMSCARSTTLAPRSPPHLPNRVLRISGGAELSVDQTHPREPDGRRPVRPHPQPSPGHARSKKDVFIEPPSPNTRWRLEDADLEAADPRSPAGASTTPARTTPPRRASRRRRSRRRRGGPRRRAGVQARRPRRRDTLGPLISARQRERVEGFLERTPGARRDRHRRREPERPASSSSRRSSAACARTTR